MRTVLLEATLKIKDKKMSNPKFLTVQPPEGTKELIKGFFAEKIMPYIKLKSFTALLKIKIQDGAKNDKRSIEMKVIQINGG